jgi:hypothetical protein
LPSHQFPYNAPVIGTGSVYTVWYQSNRSFPSVGCMWASPLFAPQIPGGILEQHENAASPESLVRHELCAITRPWVADMDSIAVPQVKRAFKKKSTSTNPRAGRPRQMRHGLTGVHIAAQGVRGRAGRGGRPAGGYTPWSHHRRSSAMLIVRRRLTPRQQPRRLSSDGSTGGVAKLASVVGLEDRQLSDLLSRASIDRMIFWPWRASAAR